MSREFFSSLSCHMILTCIQTSDMGLELNFLKLELKFSTKKNPQINLPFKMSGCH